MKSYIEYKLVSVLDRTQDKINELTAEQKVQYYNDVEKLFGWELHCKRAKLRRKNARKAFKRKWNI